MTWVGYGKRPERELDGVLNFDLKPRAPFVFFIPDSFQARGELVGHKNAFDADAQQIQTELKAQQEISVVRRVNEQVLSPEAGQQTK